MNAHIKSPRLYIQAMLNSGGSFPLPEAQGHYVRNVMRLGTNDVLRIFNGIDGEWLAEIITAEKKAVVVKLAMQLKPQPPNTRTTHLIFAPIKKAQMEWMIEKSVELGVTDFHPAITQHTEMRIINDERMRAQIIEASEQCERLDIPNLRAPSPLAQILGSWKGPGILAAIEREEAPLLQTTSQDIAFLVGPEGGFSADEKKLLMAHPAVKPVSLGPLILRAETAALKMLSLRN